MTQSLQMILQRTGVLTPQQLELTVRQAKARNVPLWNLVVLDRRVPEESLAEAFSRCLNLPRVRLDSIGIEAHAISAVPERLARLHTCLAVSLAGKDLTLAMANPLDASAIQDVQFASSRVVRPVVASRSEILRAIDRHYPSRDAVAPAPPAEFELRTFSEGTEEPGEWNLDSTDTSDAMDVAPIIGLCNSILRDAIALRASDIHIEPGATELRVRLRIDGVLREHLELPRWMRSALASRIKILATLDIAQQRLPQDGRIRVVCRGRRSDVRVSTLPTQFGEKVVLRLLGSASLPVLDALDLSPDERSLLEAAVGQPQGFILVTGPTGAGKSTTLYSMIAHRRSPALNIVTIEDPIEYQLPGINQVQIDAKGGLTFARSLRAILRQDPDIILVGEIRDLETAEVALQAALTGHLVFSTLHSNSAVAAIERLLDLGVSPPLVTAATSLVVAQRLLRRICKSCRAAYSPHPEVLQKLRIDASNEFFCGKGCEKCEGTGYAGRIGVFEILRLTPTLKELIKRRATESEITRVAGSGVTRFLLDDAMRKVREGLTTVDEVARVIQIDHAGDPPPNRFALGMETTGRARSRRGTS